MRPKSRFLFCCVVFNLATLGAASGQTSEAVATSARHVKVSEAVGSSLVAQKTALKYPDAARDAGIQGTVVLKVIASATGDVKEVTVVAGDPLLAQAATDAVKQWKYNPYTVDGEPVEMETQVSINFHFKTAEHAAPPLGNFRDDTYENEFFGLNYPLSRDWVRETEVMRKRTSEGGRLTGVYVLLAAVHIPQQTAPLEADSSFVLSALESGSRSCEQYFQSLVNDLHSRKVAQQKGTVRPLTVAGRDFYRADFEFRESPSHRTFLCTKSGDYLLQWNIAALSKGAVESTASTLNAVHATIPNSCCRSSSNRGYAG
jgi:TonB family protein